MLISIFNNARKTIKAPEAIIKSNKFDSTADIGKISFGKYILATRLPFPIRLLVANVIEDRKKDGEPFYTQLLISPIFDKEEKAVSN